MTASAVLDAPEEGARNGIILNTHFFQDLKQRFTNTYVKGTYGYVRTWMFIQGRLFIR